MNPLQHVVDLGPSVTLPLLVLVIGLALRQGVGDSLRAGLTIGVGFVGIGLVIRLLTDNLGPAAAAMAHRYGVGLSILDVGWPGTAPMAWASSMGLLSIPVAIGVNVLMLVTRMTRVVNVDVWNIWHIAFTGAIVQIATGSFWWGVVGVVAHSVISCKLGDIFGPVTDDYFRLEGIAIPLGPSASLGIFAVPIDDLIERIPWLRSIKLTTATLEKRLGAFGQPLAVGAALGSAIGFLAGYAPGEALRLGVQMGAVMVLMPMVVGLIMQGLLPVAAATQAMLKKRFAGADYRIGVDSALLFGDTQVVTAGLLFVPITVAIAFIVPGNAVLPFGDLATIGAFVAMAVGVHKGNIFRTLVSGSVILFITIWIANQMWSLQTELATQTGLLGGAVAVGSLDEGGSPITYLLARGLDADVSVGFVVILVLYVAAFVYSFRKYRTRSPSGRTTGVERAAT